MNHRSDGENPILPCRRVFFAFAALTAFLLIIYSNSLDCSWHFDDAANITNNTAIHLKTLSWQEIKNILLKGHAGTGASPRPAAYLSFALNHLWGGLDVFGYHLVNLWIHILASLFLFLVIHEILNLEDLKRRYGPIAYPAALLASLFWAAHPIQTQSVTYIVQRMTSLAGLFFLMSLFFYLKARLSIRPGRAVVLFGAFLFAFLTALASKENALLLLPSIGLFEFLLMQTTGSRSSGEKGKLFLAILGITGLIGFLWAFLGNDHSHSVLFGGYDYRPFTLWQRLLTESRVIVFYLSLLIYPMPGRLSIIHGFQISTSLFHPVSTLASVVLILGVIGLLIVLAKKHPLISFSFLFFFVNHLMESTILPLELAYEHRNYIPSMFFFMPFAVGYCSLLERFRTQRVMRFLLCFFGVMALAGFGHATYVRNFAWKSPQSLWLDAALKAPGESRVHYNLAAQYQASGQAQKAMAAYEKGISLHNHQRKGEEAVAYHNLGNLYQDLGYLERAEDFYQKAVQVDPNCYPALNSLAVLYERQGRMDAVLPLIKKAIEVEPGSLSANFNLGLFYLKKGEPGKAEPFLKVAMRDPGLQHSALISLGVANKQMGQAGKAAMFFEQALLANPRDMTPRLHLIEIYQGAGLETRSLAHAEALLEIMARDEALFNNTVDFILHKSGSKETDLSGKVVLQAIRRAMRLKKDVLDSHLNHLEKLLDKNSKIE